jgi:small nuclear ribonucleoprotein (snRNP)-like protein
MSKIEKILCDAAEIDPKRGEDRQDFLKRLVTAVGKLPDADWDKIDGKAQDWINAATDALNAKKDVEDFPDLPKEEPAEGTRRRRASADEPAKDKPYEPKLKDDVVVVTKRDKTITGKIVELDKEVVVLKDTVGEEHELAFERIASIKPLNGGGSGKADEPEGPADPKVGDTVTLTTKRDKVYTGEVVEITDKIVVIKGADGEDEFDIDRVKEIKVHGKRAAESGSTRRRSSEEPAKDAKDEKKEPAARTRASNGGVSVSQRITELIIDDMEAKEEDIGKILKKEGIEFKENTLGLNYVAVHKVLAALKAAKKLK